MIDNASSDGSLDLIRQRIPSVRLIEMENNRGPCAARNVGLQEASTEWVLQIDSDVIVQQGTLLELLPEIKLKGVAVVQPRAVLAHDPGVVHYDGGSFHYVGVMCLDNLLARVEGVPRDPEDVDAVISMALLLHRPTVSHVGGWDEAFFILFEDHDMSYRLRARGYRLRRVAECGGSAPRGHGRNFFSTRGAPVSRAAGVPPRAHRPYLVLKNYSWPAIFLSLPGRLAYSCVWAGFALSRGVLLDYLRGRLALLTLLPEALRMRRKLSRERVVGDGRLLGCRDLSFSPVIQRSGTEAKLIKLLNGALSTWWAVVGRLLPRDSGNPEESAHLSSET